MTEQEWLACSEPQAMLESLGNNISDRKLRLWISACVQQVPELLQEERWRTELEWTEYCVENPQESLCAETTNSGPLLGMVCELDNLLSPPGCASQSPNLQEGIWAIWRAKFGRLMAYCQERTSVGASNVPLRAALIAMTIAPWAVAKRINPLDGPARETALAREEEIQCDLLRDIWGNPFRSVTLDPSWLTWNNNCVVRIAEGIYADRAFNHLPILADALEDAGCIDQQILTHLRGPGNHVRGCFAVDLCLGKT